jgi:alpha-ketoglutarate-dependent taurine dioxygenase
VGAVVHPAMTALDVRPLGPHIGAEVCGVDLASELDESTVAAIRAAWLEHLVLFFPGQDLNPESQQQLGARFGEITEGHPVETPLDDHPNVHPIDSMFGHTDFWHTDVTFMSTPPSASMLYSIKLPELGGDTMWASTRAAYDTLAPALRDFCDTLTAVHYSEYYANEVARGNGKTWGGKPVEKLWPVEHPVVRVHPETGRKALYVNVGHTARFKGWTADESAPLLNFLFQHQTKPEFTCRFSWEPGSIAFWDNRCAQHNPVNDYHGFRRVMHRVTLKGDRPRGSRTVT